MAKMTIAGAVQNTRNNVTDADGYALPPLAANLKEGQIAVNTCETDPCIFFKTSEGKIVKIVSEEKLTKALTDILGNSAADLDTLRELIALFEGSANDILPMLTALTDRVTAAETSLTSKADKSALNAHTGNTSNPHSVNKEQVGLGNVDNTADSAKPVSTAQATAIADAKKAGTDAQTSLTSHVDNKANPHGVNAEQVGALAVGGTAVNSDRLDNLDSSDFARYTYKPTDDCNSLFDYPSGLHQLDGILTNAPTGTANMRVMQIGTGGRSTQMAFDWVSDRAWFRRKQDASISNWNEFYHSGNAYLRRILIAKNQSASKWYLIGKLVDNHYNGFNLTVVGNGVASLGNAVTYKIQCHSVEGTIISRIGSNGSALRFGTTNGTGREMFLWVSSNNAEFNNISITEDNSYGGAVTYPRADGATPIDSITTEITINQVWDGRNSNNNTTDWYCKNLRAASDVTVSGSFGLPYNNALVDTSHGRNILKTGWLGYYGDCFELCTTGTAENINKLIGGSNGSLRWIGNDIYHSGNSNKSDVDWRCSKLITTEITHENVIDKPNNGWTGYYLKYGGWTEAQGDHTLISTVGGSVGKAILSIGNSYSFLTGGRFGFGTTSPTISLAIGDSDTGFNWHSDGDIGGYANGVNVFTWNSGHFHLNKKLNYKDNQIIWGIYGDAGNTNVGIGETTLSREIKNIGYRDSYPENINAKIVFENYNKYGVGALYQGGRIAFYCANDIASNGDVANLAAKIDDITGLTVEKNVIAKGDIIAKKSGAVTFSTSDAAAGATRLNDLQDVKLPDNLSGKMVLAYDPAQVNSDGTKGGYTFMPSAGTGTGTVSSTEIASLPDHNHNDIVYTSDERLKNNITDLKDRAIKMILSLAPKSFGWNDKAKSFGLNDSISYGLIAQEVEKVMPELVKPLGKEDYIGVDYIKIIPILLAGVQEQHKEIIALNQKLKTIQARANKAYGNETNNADEIANLKADNITLKAEIEELKMLIKK